MTTHIHHQTQYSDVTGWMYQENTPLSKRVYLSARSVGVTVFVLTVTSPWRCCDLVVRGHDVTPAFVCGFRHTNIVFFLVVCGTLCVWRESMSDVIHVCVDLSRRWITGIHVRWLLELTYGDCGNSRVLKHRNSRWCWFNNTRIIVWTFVCVNLHVIVCHNHVVMRLHDVIRCSSSTIYFIMYAFTIDVDEVTSFIVCREQFGIWCRSI